MAIGRAALYSNTTGIDNSATGVSALQNNTTGIRNTASGFNALATNTTGSANTAYGAYSLYGLTTGSYNVDIGYNNGAPTTGSRNITIGNQINIASSTLDGQLNIGNIIFGTGVTGTGSTIAGRIGIGTTTPDATLALQQTINGVPVISAYRVTDAAPSGDFINYKTKSGTTLFRVDNSGNLLAGGIVNSGSQTITSTSQPQFRLQYDPTNELTFSTNSTGTTTIGVNGSAPALVFTPQSNLVNTFNFTDAASNSVLSIDTLNKRVGIGTTSPAQKLAVAGNIDVTPSATIGSLNGFSVSGATGNIDFGIKKNAADNRFTGMRVSEVVGTISPGSGNLDGVLQFYTDEEGAVYSTERMRITGPGNVGIGTTTPLSKLAVSGGASIGADYNIAAPTNGLIVEGNVGVGIISPAEKLHIAGNGNMYLKVTSSDNSISGIKFSGAGERGSIYTDGNYDIYISPNAAVGDPTQFARTSINTVSGTGNVLIGNSSNRVGIASTTPWGQLSVNPNGITGPAFVVGSSTATNFIVTNGGNVGIGTASPTANLHVIGGSGSGLAVQTANSGSYGLFVKDSLGVSGIVPGVVLQLNGNSYITTTGLTIGGSSGGSNIDSLGASPLYLNVYQGRDVVISQSAYNNGLRVEGTGNSSFMGNVGIGTTTPQYKLDVAGFINTDQYSGYKQAGNTVLYASTTNNSLAVGASSAAAWMSASSTPWYSIAIGQGALGATPTSGGAQYNTALGYDALISNTTGSQNNAIGTYALRHNTTGTYNTAIGVNALHYNTTGSNNTAIGRLSLYTNVSGSNNIAIGSYALESDASANSMVAVGYFAGYLSNNVQGGTYLGYQSGYSATTGADYNTLLGYNAGAGVTTGARNVLIGQSTISASWNQVTTGSNNIAIGNDVAVASPTASNQLNIGNLIYGTGLSGTGSTISSGNVGVGSTTPWGQLSVNPNGISGPAFVIGSSTATNFIVTNGGNVGVANSSPSARLHIGATLNDIPSYVLTDPSALIVSKNPYNVGNVIEPVLTLARAGSPGSVYPDFAELRMGNTCGGSGGCTRLDLALNYGTGATTTIMTWHGNGLVGIGTVNPTTLLDVRGTLNATGVVSLATTTISSTPALAAIGSLATLSLRRPQSNGISFGNSLDIALGGWATDVAGTSRTRVDFILNNSNTDIPNTTVLTMLNNGNVGIGTTNPTSKLYVAGDIVTSARIAINDSFVGSYTFVNSGDSIFRGTIRSTAGRIENGTYTYVDFPAAWTFVTPNAAGSAGLPRLSIGANADTANVLITNSNVGIGVTSPAQKLDVAGFINTDQYSGYKQAGNTVLYASTTNFSTLVGNGAGAAMLSDGLYNTALGYQALNAATSSDYNTAVGYRSLYANTTGVENVAVGFQSLDSNTTGFRNVALGNGALGANTTGESNTAVGWGALSVNTTGSWNTAIGYLAFSANTIGYENTVLGYYSLAANTTGNFNVTTGNAALRWNTTGGSNIAMGYSALLYNTSATSSTALGYAAGRGTAAYSNQGGVYLGYQSGYSAATGSDYNTLLGYQSGYGVTTGARNVLIGQSTIAASYNQVTTGSNNIAIGNDVAVASPTASNQLNIGNLIYGTGLNGTGATLSTGNVGIGTTTPQEKLHVLSATGNGRIYIESENTGSNSGIQLYARNSSAARTASGLYFTPATASALGYLTMSGDASGAHLNVTSAGNVGIGTTTPLSKLAVSGGASIGADYNVAAPTNGLIVEGNVGIGVTNPGQRLAIVNTVASGGTIPSYLAYLGSVTQTYGTTNESNAVLAIYGSNGVNARSVTLGIGVPSTYGAHDTGFLNLGTGAIWNTGSGVFKFSTVPGTSYQGNQYDGFEFYNSRSDNQDAYTFYSSVPTYNGTAMKVVVAATAGVGNLLSLQSGQGGNFIVTGTGKVGIQTANPVARLTIATTTAGANELLSLVTNYSTQNTAQSLTWRDSSNITGQIDTRYNGTTVDMFFGHLYNSGYQTGDLVTIKGTGNVGIGTTTPTVKLNVIGAAAFQNTSSWPTNGYGIEIAPNITTGVDAIQAYNRDTSAWRQLRIEASSIILNDVTGGNVGIGTASPNYANLVIGNASYYSGNTSGEAISRATSLPTALADYGNLYLFSTDAMAANKGGTISFGANYNGVGDTKMAAIFGGKENANNGDLAGYFSVVTRNAAGTLSEGMRIDSIGNVGIGTTSPDMLLSVGSATPTGSVAHFENSTGSCYINPTTTALVCSSDQRLKHNFNAISTSTALAGIRALSPTFYNWNSETAGTAEHAGFIAQEVQPIFPDLVATAPDGYLTMNYAGLTPYLTAALQGIAATVDGHDMRITSLESRLAALESGAVSSTSGSPLSLASTTSQLVAWFADAGNGIGELFANRVHTKELCVSDGASETCVTKARLDALIAGTAAAVIDPAPTAPTSTDILILPAATSTEPIIGATASSTGSLQAGTTTATTSPIVIEPLVVAPVDATSTPITITEVPQVPPVIDTATTTPTI